MKSERLLVRWSVGWLFVGLVGWLFVGLSGPAFGLVVAKFSSTFCFVRNNLEHFLALSFCASRCTEKERMWAAGGNTQYKSHLDLCHAFNWLLCRCRCSTCLSALSSTWFQAQTQEKPTVLPSSISCKIEFGGGQKTKKYKWQGLFWAWVWVWVWVLRVFGRWPPFCQQLKPNFSGHHLRDFQSQLKTNFA